MGHREHLWKCIETKLQNYKITKLQNYKITKLQNYKITKLQNYKITKLKLQKYKIYTYYNGRRHITRSNKKRQSVFFIW